MQVHGFICAGLMIAAACSFCQYLCQRIRDHKRNFVFVIGSVAYMEQRSSSKGRTAYVPVFHYEYGGLDYYKIHNDSTFFAFQISQQSYLCVPSGKQRSSVGRSG